MIAREWTREELDRVYPLPEHGGWAWAYDASLGWTGWYARDNNGATVCVDPCGDLLALWNGTIIISPDADVCLAVILASKGLDSLGAMAAEVERLAPIIAPVCLDNVPVACIPAVRDEIRKIADAPPRDGAAMSHTCHAHGCTAEVPPKMFMCRTHWAKLRKVTQNAIWREYTPGQERRKDPTARYLAVQQYAIGEVAFRPNDEDAAKVAAGYIAKAMQWRQMAIDAGDGDPLDGVAKARAKPAPIVAGRGKVLSVWAPWAQLFFIGEDPKDVENRPWVTTYRGPVYIHCSKGGHSRSEVALILGRLVDDGMITSAQANAVEDRVELDRGHVIGVVQLVGAKRFSRSRWWFKGEVALEVTGAKLIDRIPHRGEQGLRDFVLPN